MGGVGALDKLTSHKMRQKYDLLESKTADPHSKIKKNFDRIIYFLGMEGGVAFTFNFFNFFFPSLSGLFFSITFIY